MKSVAQTTEVIAKSRFNPQIFIAQNEDGPAIGELVKSNGSYFEADWTDIFPYWLVAKYEGEIIGCLQILPGKPVARAEMLCTKLDLDGPKRANVGWRLIQAGLNTLRISGAEHVNSIISFDNKHFKKLLKKRGWQIVNQGNLMMARI